MSTVKQAKPTRHSRAPRPRHAVTVVAHGSRGAGERGAADNLEASQKHCCSKHSLRILRFVRGLARRAASYVLPPPARAAVPSMEFGTRFFDRHIACGGPFAELCSSTTKKLTKACYKLPLSLRGRLRNAGTLGRFGQISSFKFVSHFPSFPK